MFQFYESSRNHFKVNPFDKLSLVFFFTDFTTPTFLTQLVLTRKPILEYVLKGITSVRFAQACKGLLTF